MEAIKCQVPFKGNVCNRSHHLLVTCGHLQQTTGAAIQLASKFMSHSCHQAERNKKDGALVAGKIHEKSA